MKDNRVYLLQIVDFIGKIESYTTGGRDEFMNSPMIQDAVIRNFEIIGEAAKQVSEPVKNKYPEIPWRKVAGFRDILIHQYNGCGSGCSMECCCFRSPRVESGNC